MSPKRFSISATCDGCRPQTTVTSTLPVGMANMVGQWDSPWQLIAAGVVIASLPIFIIYLLIQDLYVRGLTAGALKG